MKSIRVALLCGLLVGLLGNLCSVHSADPKINLQALKAKRIPILLEFGRGWCIPCKHMKPILEDMSRAYDGKAIVITVDMDANKDLVRDFRIRMMPTLVFVMPDGKEFFRKEGIMERPEIVQVFSKIGVSAPAFKSAVPAGGPREAVLPSLPLPSGR